MIACVAKTAQNADFYQIIDFLTGCSINYSLLVDPDLIGPWLQQFWATASLKVINDVPHIRAKVAGKKILISEATIRADLLFDDENGVECFPKQVIWDLLRDIGYEGNLAQLTFSKPLFSPQWKYLVHVLLHCLSPKSTSWEQFGTNHCHSALRSIELSSRSRNTPLTPTMLEYKEPLPIHRNSAHLQGKKLHEQQGTDDFQGFISLYRVVDDYYEHIPPTGLGLMLLGDLNIIWETAESSDDDFWKDQEEWEIIRWRELLIRNAGTEMEVEDESETAITLIHLFILWTTANGDNS
ncbi:hypothetical protein Tco_0526573 [Tanacetum coccineum]